MKFLIKIETVINNLLFKLGAWIFKILPSGLKKKIERLALLFENIKLQLKNLPQNTKRFSLDFLAKMKAKIQSLEIKNKINEKYQNLKKSNQSISKREKIKKIGLLFLRPFLKVGNWFRGLSAQQAFVLLAFTGASFLSALHIFFSGQRIADDLTNSQRSPASQNEEVSYDRPEYYKKETKHYSLSKFKVPVYFAKTNELKSVEIDFVATLSNRFSRKFLEKNEYKLRDFIILQMEPTIAVFPLEEEGKEIFRKKLQKEITKFLSQNSVEGKVVELKIVYVLAN